MRNSILIGLCLLMYGGMAQRTLPQLEACPCLMKIDPRLESRCGYLVVPENRSKPGSHLIKVPYVFVRRPDQDSSRNIVLYTTGGPGYATIPVGDSIGYDSGRLAFGGFIFFDQRGTKNSIPCLDCEGIDEAVRMSYVANLPKDSLIGLAVKKCRAEFIRQGVDLSAYNTVESAADIADLKNALGIDSLTLFGTSYSGGLMLTVARNHPRGIKALLLNSPLPGYVNYEEHALFNHNEALETLFDGVERDTVQNHQFPNLRFLFKEYFSKLSVTKFQIEYLDQKTHLSYPLIYSRNELLDAIIDRMNNSEFRTVPQVIWDIVHGEHQIYIARVFDDKFSTHPGLSYGMRLSVYCSEQIAYSDITKIKEQDQVLPWLAGYPFNNVNHRICDCWKVNPSPAYVKSPVYSNIPALVTAGALDPWTRPFYNHLIKRSMPNAQLVLIKNKTHGAGFGTSLLQQFMINPYTKLISASNQEIIE